MTLSYQLQQKEMLVFGYIRHQFDKYKIKHMPLPISNLCFAYFAPKLVFDHFNDETCETNDSLDGHLMHAKNGSSPRTYVFVCSFGMKYGMHSWSLKVHECASNDSIGIVSKKPETMKGLDHPLYNQQYGHSYFWWRHVHEINAGAKDYKVNDQWEADDTLSYVLDCNEWRLTFYLNQKQVITIDVAKNETYFAAIAFDWRSARYESIAALF